MEETMVVEGADTVGQGEVVSTGILQDNPLLFGSDLTRDPTHHHQDVTAQGTIIVLAFDLKQNL
jgi:hypothetical protein